MSTVSSPPLRATRQRSAILAELDSAAEFVSAQALHARLSETDARVGLSTVYRTLQALAASGEVDVILAADGEAQYRSCSSGHHHHLVCRTCGRTVEVRSTSVERWAAALGAEHGFADVTHTVEVFGVCADCAGDLSVGDPDAQIE